MVTNSEPTAGSLSRLPTVSVIVPTRERPESLLELLLSLCRQSYGPSEVIIIDDSPKGSAEITIERFRSVQNPVPFRLKYLSGTGRGNTSARNMGIAAATEEAVLFLDDDIVVDSEAIRVLAKFLSEHADAVGVQPIIVGFGDYWETNRFGTRLENLIYKVLMLNYHERNTLSVRKSGTTIYPTVVTRTINAQRFSGCCLIKRRVLAEFRFDTNLMRWGLYDDLDLSHRIYRRYPGSLFVVPNAKIEHRHSPVGRLAVRTLIYMAIIYWFYVFFKDFYKGSKTNLLAFLWALTGYTFWAGFTMIAKLDRQRTIAFSYLLPAQFQALRYLKSIMAGDLDFFNKTLPI